MNAVEVRHLSKTYPLEKVGFARFRQVMGGGSLAGGIQALQDVSFSIRRGEAFGIIGSNGSGKSTILQIIAGLLQPTSGSAEVHGRLSALLELGSGFSPEFSGRDNVYLNGAILGLTTQEIKDRFETIERFAEIGDFIEQPIKTYSTGMVLRLAFAVAAHVDPEILIVDEALAVGDIAFRQRCMKRIHDLRARGTTILFVSHETSDVKALCDRCIWLRAGVTEELGDAEDVVQKYMLATARRESAQLQLEHAAEPAGMEAESEPDEPMALGGRHRVGDGRALITGAELRAPDGSSLGVVEPLNTVILRLRFAVKGRIDAPLVGFLVRNAKGENIFGSNTARENYPVPSMTAGHSHVVEFRWTMPELPSADYAISVGVADGDNEHSVLNDYVDDAIAFSLRGIPGQTGFFRMPCAAVTVHQHS